MPEPVNRSAAAAVDGVGGAVPAGPASWLGALGACLFPPRCLACGAPGVDGESACAPCRASLPWHPPGIAIPAPAPVRRVHAAFDYRFPLDRLLPRFKFHGDLAAGRQLAAWMARACADAPRPGALVPVPLHRGRLRSRGYDQALELARPLARALGLPLRTGLLHRVRATEAQSRLDAAARAANLRGAFAVPARGPPALPAHVALVDDVMTTGATLRAAALALHDAGVARVDAWVCARVEDPLLRTCKRTPRSPTAHTGNTPAPAADSR